MLNKLPIYRQFIEGISEYSVNGLNDSFNKLTFEFGKDEIRKLIVLVRDVKFDKELLDFLSKTIFVKGEKYDQEISVIDDFTCLNENDYLFIVGFTYGDFPKVRKDTDFFSDKEKEVLNINTSASFRDIEKDLLKSLINSSPNIYISYHEVDGKNKFNVSQIANELNLELIEGKVDNKRYSKKLAEMEVANLIDKKRVYGEESDYINTFTKDEIGYNSYDNQFNANLPYNDKGLDISYSQIEKYNECPFAFYLERKLNLNSDSDTFFTRFGSMAHKVLEDSITKDILEDDIPNYIDDYFEDIKDKHFAYRLAYQLIEVIKENEGFKESSSLKEREAELKCYYKVDTNTMLNGTIDKIEFDSNSKKGIIVDYKSGNFHFDKEKIQYGLGMQLIIYSLLLENTNSKKIVKDLELLGIYIQKITFDDTKDDNETPYILNGLTVVEGVGIGEFGNINLVTLNPKKYLKGITITGKGCLHGNTIKGNNLISKKDFDILKKETKKQIDKVISGIRNNNFSINPIEYFKTKSSSEIHCDYCEFRDICYRREKNIKIVHSKEGNSDAIYEGTE